MVTTRVLGLLAAVFSTALLHVATHADDTAFRPLINDGVPATAVRGIWRSRGYGWLLQLTESDLIVHHVSKAACTVDPRPLRFVDQFAFWRVNAQSSQLQLTQYPGESTYHFDRLSDLPSDCEKALLTPVTKFEHFVATYREQYAFFKERDFDWEARARAQRTLVTDKTSPRVLFAILSDLLDGLGDAHVGMNALFRNEPVQFRAGRGPTIERVDAMAVKAGSPLTRFRNDWFADQERRVREIVLGGKWQESAGGRMSWGMIGTDIGYLRLSAVDGFTQGDLADNISFVNTSMDRILSEFVGVSAIVVDATINLGGYDRLAREIAGHFAAERIFAYSKRPFGVDGVEADKFYAEPSVGRRFLGQVYLLTSDLTVSAGEILAMTMRVLPNVTQIGTPTHGALSDRLTKVMPDGSDFSISNEIYLDANGELFEVVGVPPHRFVEFFPEHDLNGGHARAVARLIEEIRTGTAGQQEVCALSRRWARTPPHERDRCRQKLASR